MNFPSVPAGLVLLLLAFGFAPAVPAQTFSIRGHAVAGGGGTSAAGVFAVSGTMGPPDAGTGLIGGGFTLTGGFWSALPAPGAPRLSLRVTNANRLVISWPSSSIGFTLQQAAGLSPSDWGPPAEPIGDDGTNKFILVDPVPGSRFYRLFAP